MNKLVTTSAAVVAALLTLLAPGRADAQASARPVRVEKPASPSTVAKAALVKGVRKVEKYAAAHGALPSDGIGLKLVRSKQPKALTFTFRAVTGSRPGYCVTVVSKQLDPKRPWVHDSWLGKTWRATASQALDAGGACAAVTEQASPDHAKDELKVAVADTYAVVDAVDAYYEDPDVESLPATLDAPFLAAQGVALTAGSSIVGYEVYDVEEDLYRFCLVRDSGAWATYDEDEADIVARGTTGAACTS